MLKSDLISFFVYRERPHQLSDCGQKLCGVHHCRRNFDTWWNQPLKLRCRIQYVYQLADIAHIVKLFHPNYLLFHTDKIFQTISFVPYAEFMLTRQRHDNSFFERQNTMSVTSCDKFQSIIWVVSSKKNNQVNFPVSSLRLNTSL